MGQALGCAAVSDSIVALKELFGADTASLRVQNLHVRCETKTQDDILVAVVASIQYRAMACTTIDKLCDCEAHIKRHVFDVITTRVPRLKVEFLLKQRNGISKALKEELGKVMCSYEIVEAHIVDIQLDEFVPMAIKCVARREKIKWALDALIDMNYEKVGHGIRAMEGIMLAFANEAKKNVQILKAMEDDRLREAAVNEVGERAKYYFKKLSGLTFKEAMDMALKVQDVPIDHGATSTDSPLGDDEAAPLQALHMN